MTPQRMLANLDRHLAKAGQDVTLRRRIGTTDTFVEVVCRAKVEGFDSEVLIGGVKQTASTFIMSPSAISTANTAGLWPAAAGGGIWPVIGDLIDQGFGKGRKIEAVRPIIINGTVVRIGGKVLG